MASTAFKLIRRLVNILALALLLDALLVIGYIISGPRAIENFEKCTLTTISGISISFLNYLSIGSLFLAMLASTSINSKSKFTLKIAVTGGTIYFLFILSLFIYFSLIYAPKIISLIYENRKISTDAQRIQSFIILMGRGEEITLMNENTLIEIARDILTKEIYCIKVFFVFACVTGAILVLLLIASTHCKISKSKEDPVKECEVYARPVGLSTPALSLRMRKIQK